MTGEGGSGAALFLAGLRRDYVAVMRRWSDFSGRSDLSEFLTFFLIYAALYFAAFVLDALVSLVAGPFRGVRVVITLVHALPNLALLARRLHDIDLRAWFMFWPFVAVRAFYRPGTPGPNRFGPEPPERPTGPA